MFRRLGADRPREPPVSLLSYSANDIPSEGVSIQRELPPAWVTTVLQEDDLRADQPGNVEARLSRLGTDVIVRGKVHAALIGTCSRCLEPARLEVDGELALLLKADPSLSRKAIVAAAKAEIAKAEGKAEPAPKKGDRGAHGGGRPDAKAKHRDVEYEFSPEEAEHDAYDGENVVLDPFVREAILLEVPNSLLCSEDCAGIALPHAEPNGHQANGSAVDPRLAPLQALKARLEGGGDDANAAGSKRKRNKE